MEDRPVTELFKDLFTSFSALMKSEIQLARAELVENSKVVGKNGARIGVFAFLAVLGTLAFVSFLIIGLGDLLGGRYWLSALLVSLVFLVPSALAIQGSLKKIQYETGFDRVKRNIELDRELISAKVEDLKAAPRTAASARHDELEISA